MRILYRKKITNLLVQQAIQAAAVQIAKGYIGKPEWQVAAANLRQPYWDWAQNTLLPDQIIKQETVWITTPEGKRSVPNPFLSYRFHPLDKDFGSDYDKYPTTLRYPTTHDSDAKSDVETLKE